MSSKSIRLIAGFVLAVGVAVQAGLPELQVSPEIRSWVNFTLVAVLAGFTYLNANVPNE